MARSTKTTKGKPKSKKTAKQPTTKIYKSVQPKLTTRSSQMEALRMKSIAVVTIVAALAGLFYYIDGNWGKDGIWWVGITLTLILISFSIGIIVLAVHKYTTNSNIEQQRIQAELRKKDVELLIASQQVAVQHAKGATYERQVELMHHKRMYLDEKQFADAVNQRAKMIATAKQENEQYGDFRYADNDVEEVETW